jgi:two-component system cell cycle sensor histidine kinase/response regulator CckA
MPETVCDVCGEKFSGDHVLLTMTDTGQGMDQHKVEQMFNPFFSTKEVGQGTGLGLSVVLGLMQDHGGHINCESTPGVGTSFRLYFPAFLGEAGAGKEAQSAKDELPGGSEMVLLVDDEELLRNLGSRYLGKAGYQIIQADSGEEALGIYRDRGGEIALVVLDLGMAGMGGQRCLQEILALDPKAKVVIASGYTDDAQVEAAQESGAMAFVAKPWKSADLLKTIRSVLDRK